MVKAYWKSFRVCKYDKSKAIFNWLYDVRLKKIERNWYSNDLTNLWCWESGVPCSNRKYLLQTKLDFWWKLLIFQMPNTTLSPTSSYLSQPRGPLQEYFGASCIISTLISCNQNTLETFNLSNYTSASYQWKAGTFTYLKRP